MDAAAPKASTAWALGEGGFHAQLALLRLAVQVPLGSSGEAAIYTAYFPRAVVVAEDSPADPKLAELYLF
jgi:hypothetical protein